MKNSSALWSIIKRKKIFASFPIRANRNSNCVKYFIDSISVKTTPKYGKRKLCKKLYGMITRPRITGFFEMEEAQVSSLYVNFYHRTRSVAKNVCNSPLRSGLNI